MTSCLSGRASAWCLLGVSIVLVSLFRDGQKVCTERLIEPQGDEKLTLPLLVLTLTVKVAACWSVMFWVAGETVIPAAPEPAARTVAGPVFAGSVTVMVAEPFLWTRSGLGEAAIEHWSGCGVGNGVGVDVSTGAVVTCLLANPVHLWVASS